MICTVDSWSSVSVFSYVQQNGNKVSCFGYGRTLIVCLCGSCEYLTLLKTTPFFINVGGVCPGTSISLCIVYESLAYDFRKWLIWYSKTYVCVLRVGKKRTLNDNLRKAYCFQISMCLGKCCCNENLVIYCNSSQ